MSIDPRIVSTMLRMQMSAVPDFTGRSPLYTTNDRLSMFDNLLVGLMTQLEDGAGRMQPLSSPAFMPVDPGLPNWQDGWRQAAHVDGTESAQTGYEPLIREAANKYGVDESLVKAVISAESSFHADAVSASGAKGLMQLMDDTARSLGVSDSFDPRQNIEAGTRYLSYLIRRYDGSVQTALAAYNAGSGTLGRLGIGGESELVSRFGSLPQETQRYVTKVLHLQTTYTV